MVRKLLSICGVPAVVAAALFLFPTTGLAAQHSHHSAAVHSGHGVSHGVTHGGAWHGGTWHGDRGGWHGGYYGGYYGRGLRFYGGYGPYYSYYYGGSPFYWDSYNPGWYYGSDYYSYPDYSYYSAPTIYNYVEPAVQEPAVGYQDQADQRVTARVVLPTPDATLWVEGQQTTSTGDSRMFVSPPLAAGEYTYNFRARWSQDGQTFDQTRRVQVHPGDRISVDFTAPQTR